MAMRYHQVRKGETLATIAQAYYGDPAKWAYIYRHNTHFIPDPNHLDPGQRILIPHLVLPGLLNKLRR